MDQGVVAILGDVTTQPTWPLCRIRQDNMPMITASATATSVTYDAETDTVHTNVFRSCFIDPFQGVTMANFASGELGAKTAAVLYDNGDPYSTGVYQYFINQCKEVGIDVVAEESYATGSVDFSGQLTNIASKNPDILFLPIYYNDVALVATQAAAAGLKAKMLGVDGWASVLDVVTDPALIEGAYYCSGYSPEDTSVGREFPGRLQRGTAKSPTCSAPRAMTPPPSCATPLPQPRRAARNTAPPTTSRPSSMR